MHESVDLGGRKSEILDREAHGDQLPKHGCRFLRLVPPQGE
jgi:hypothetical protein